MKSARSTLSYGVMTYVDVGEGDVILSVHGIFGGLWSGLWTMLKNRTSQNRVLAPSRFGYLGSDVKGEGRLWNRLPPFEELLDYLDIDQGFCFGNVCRRYSRHSFSRSIIRSELRVWFCYCSAIAGQRKTWKLTLITKRRLKPLLSDYAMYVISPLMPPLMGHAPLRW